MRVSVASLSLLLASAQVAGAAGSITCEFTGKDSTATVTNNNTFQSQCSWECNYKTEGDDYLHRGKSGLNPGQSFTTNGTAKDNIVRLESKSVDCGGS